MKRPALALLLVLGACDTSAPAEPSATVSAATPVGVRIVSSEYGSVTLAAAPGMRCTVTVTAPLGRFSDGPPGSVSGVADATGALTLTYIAPFLPAGDATHAVTCNGSEGIVSASASFRVAAAGIHAAHFTARVEASAVVLDEHVAPDPSLVPLRDNAIGKLTADLAREWRAATRELSTVELVPANADLVIKVIAARSTPLHRSADDGSQDVLLYVADRDGPFALDNVIAVALHELGHIWCCYGPGTNNGHWTTAEESQGLQGIDRFGLMNDPVRCLVVPAGYLSCPNRFSDRELQAMGFQQLPAPAADPCVARRDALLAQIATLRSELDALKAKIDAANATLAQLTAEIEAIEKQYPSKTLPPDVYARYTALVERYNAVAADTRPKIDAYNNTIGRQNAIVAQRNALGC